MKMKTWLIGMVAGLALAQMGIASANDAKVVVKADNKDDFSAVVAAVHQQMAPGGRYEFVDRAGRSTIDTRLGEMQSLFDKYGTVAQMDKDVKIRLMNDQEEVNSILNHNDSNRKVCESGAPTGSLLPKMTCRTYGAMEKERLDSQHFMQSQSVNQTINGH